MALDWPLMENNILPEDRTVMIDFLSQNDTRLTQGEQVRCFESEFSKWLGVKYSVFVNSGSSANLLTMAALKILKGDGEVIVPTLTWSSDIASVLHAGLTPVFVDIDLKNLAMNVNQVLKKINSKTRAVFLTHVLGFNGLDGDLMSELEKRKIPLIEDACESHGATFRGKKIGSFGLASNFSFYYAHHMTTIEGGMICTNDESFYNTCRMLRSHGLVRELENQKLKKDYEARFRDLNPEFIFSMPAYNVRGTELNAVLGRHQLKRLDENNTRRVENCRTFYSELDPKKYFCSFDFEGAVNYSFVLVLKNKCRETMSRIINVLKDENVEFRVGASGGGNQLRQPYLRERFPVKFSDYPNVEHIHFFGMYIGNYPSLEEEKIKKLCSLLNSID